MIEHVFSGTTSAPPAEPAALAKEPTGIAGLDEILNGGLPKERITLVQGAPGCGKTLLSMEFLLRGALEYNQPGVFVSFEESSEELTQNVATIGFDLAELQAEQRISLLHFHLERSDFEVAGEYDLEGLFAVLGHTIDAIGAQRVVLDTVEAFIASFPTPSIVRSELRRLFRWLKNRGVTAIVTTERSGGDTTHHEIEEYVADCVIQLDNRVVDQVATRRLRVVKYRGSGHGGNPYPFLINSQGLSVLPVTSLQLGFPAYTDRISTGIPRLDSMLGGEGFLRGSSTLVSGTSGTGKTSLAGSFVDGACRRGKRCVYFASEESPAQIIRNMRSIGINLKQWVDQDLLVFHAARPTLYNLETRLVTMYTVVEQHEPAIVVADPITGLDIAGSSTAVQLMLMRLIDLVKSTGKTGLYTSLTPGGANPEQSSVGISSWMDNWLLLDVVDQNGERNRIMQIVKSRGTAHSNQIREFLITSQGIELADVYISEGGVLTGTARREQELHDEIERMRKQLTIRQQEHELQRREHALEMQTSMLSDELEMTRAELKALHKEYELWVRGREERATRRGHDANSPDQGAFDSDGDRQ